MMSNAPLAADMLLLSAGFGSRLRPLTETVPKPLITVGGKTLLERNLECIARSGLRRVLINLHYLPDQIRRFVGDGSRWGLEIELIEESVILDTGGAVKNIEPLLREEQLITFNSDILIGPEFNLQWLLESHVRDTKRPRATMVLREDEQAEAYGSLGIDAEGRVVTFLNTVYGPTPAAQILMYTGIQVLERSVLGQMPPRGQVFSLTRDTLKNLLAAGEVISGLRYDGYWNDVGTFDRLAKASKDVAGIFEVS